MVASADREMTSNANGNGKRTDDKDNENTRPNDVTGSGEPQAACVNRKLPKCCGVYGEGSIHGIPVWYTVDTGTSHTILSKRVFTKIQKVKKLCLDTQRKVPMEQASGSPLEIGGLVPADLQIGKHMFPDKEIIVADIKDDVLLGMDIGYNLDVIASEDVIRIDGRSIPSTNVRGNHLFRVTAADTYEINGDTECEIEVYIEGMVLDEYQTEMLIEPSPEFLSKCPVVVARSLVDMRNHVTGRVRVMNPFRDVTVIRQGTVVGFAEPLKNEIEIISIVIPQNDVTGDPDKSGGGSGALQSLNEHGGSNMTSGDVIATQDVVEVSDPGPLGVENKNRVVDSLPVLGKELW